MAKATSELFDLGTITVHPSVVSLLSDAQIQQLLRRHARGDWGAETNAQRERNERFVRPRGTRRELQALGTHAVGRLRVHILTRRIRGKSATHLYLPQGAR